MGTAIFFPGPYESQDAARTVCGGCEVRSECRDYALEAGEPHLVGVWAGTSTRERGKLRRVSS